MIIVVIPCYNEAARLDLSAIDAFVARERRVHLLFVDDGSTDGTGDLLRRYVATNPGSLSLWSMAVNSGKGEAVREGMGQAIARGATLVGFWDADLSAPLDAIAGMADLLQQRADIDWVIGARVRLLGRHIDRRPLRHYLGRVFATGASAVLHMPVYDTQCGAKLYRVTAELEDVLATPFVSRWIFDVEMIARFTKLRSASRARPAVDSIYEFALSRWTHRAGSKVSPSDLPRAFVELLRIWRHYQ